MARRTYFRGHALNRVAPEPLSLSLLKYRQRNDRTQVRVHADIEDDARESTARAQGANLVCSRTEDGMQMPILDLDFPHRYVPSTKPGHGHLYLDVPIPTWRWVLMMLALRVGGVLELGTVAWSLRRRANYARIPGVRKTAAEELYAEQVPSYGWFRRIR